MKIKIEKKVTIEDEIDVDDRIYNEDIIEWNMADILLGGNLDRIVENLFHKDEWVARDAADDINAAFRRADACLALVRSGKYEI